MLWSFFVEDFLLQHISTNVFQTSKQLIVDHFTPIMLSEVIMIFLCTLFELLTYSYWKELTRTQRKLERSQALKFTIWTANSFFFWCYVNCLRPCLTFIYVAGYLWKLWCQDGKFNFFGWWESYVVLVGFLFPKGTSLSLFTEGISFLLQMLVLWCFALRIMRSLVTYLIRTTNRTSITQMKNPLCRWEILLMQYTTLYYLRS